MPPDRPPLEIPPPGVPHEPPRPRPPQPEPGAVPVRSPAAVLPFDDHDDLPGRLRRDRRLLLVGGLDAESATRTAAELMLLDGESARPVELIINCTGGPIDDVLALLDVIGLMRASVTTRCIGAATGTAAVVLGRGTGGRVATASARISLRVGGQAAVDGTATDVARRADELATLYTRVATQIAAVTGLSPDDAYHALHSGAPMDAHAALAVGLIDEIAGR